MIVSKTIIIYVNIINLLVLLLEAHNVLCNLRTQSFVRYIRAQFSIPKLKRNKYLSAGKLWNLPVGVLKKRFQLTL